MLTDVSAVTPARPAGSFGLAPEPGGAAMSTYTIPSVVEKTRHGERAVDIYSRLLSDRIVYLGTEIDDGVANVVIAQLLHLESESPDSPISLYLNSPGGSVTAMLAIYDTMQFVRSHGGHDLRRAGGLVGGGAARGGAPGQRTVLPHARVVLHQPSGGGQGTLPDLALQAKEIVRVRAQMEEILSRHTGQDVERLREDTDRDLILVRAGRGRLRHRRRGAGQPEERASRRQAHRSADPPIRPGDPAGQVDQPQPERTGDGADHLGARLLAAPLDLGEVLRRDAGLRRPRRRGYGRRAAAPRGAH